MTSYRRYRAEFPFDARDSSELTVHPGDALIVSKTTDGTWPDPAKWMKGRNENTEQFGEFPGTYVKLVEEFTVQDTPPLQPPVAPPSRPPVSPPVSPSSQTPPSRPPVTSPRPPVTSPRPPVSSSSRPPVAPPSHPPTQQPVSPPPMGESSPPPPVPRRVQSTSKIGSAISPKHVQLQQQLQSELQQQLQSSKPPQPVPKPRVKRPSVSSQGSDTAAERQATSPPPVLQMPPMFSPPPTPREHEWFKVTFQIPVQCSACDDFIWGSASAGFKCTVCLKTCHEYCRDHVVATYQCVPEYDDSVLEKLEYSHTVHSYHEWTESDILLWMKAVNIDYYFKYFKEKGVARGSDLDKIDTQQLEDMGVRDELHQQIILECLSELCQGMVVADGDDTDGGFKKRLSMISLPRSPSNMSIQSMFGSLGKRRGDNRIGGHHFKSHTYTSRKWCDVCTRFLWGLIKQGMKCKACGMNVHRMCMAEGIVSCDFYRKKKQKIGPEMPTFGLELSSQFNLQRQAAPTVVLKCIEAVEARGIHLQGIYRVSSSKSSIHSLKDAFDSDASTIDPHDPQVDPHTSAGALKLYLRELPDPVFTYDLYEEFIAVGRSTLSVSYDAMNSQLQPLLERLPPHNRSTLDTILKHLYRVSTFEPQNKMSIQNMAVIFGPTLIRPPPDNLEQLVGNTEIHCKIVEVLLIKGPWIPNEEPATYESYVETSRSTGPPPVAKREQRGGSLESSSGPPVVRRELKPGTPRTSRPVSTPFPPHPSVSLPSYTQPSAIMEEPDARSSRPPLPPPNADLALADQGWYWGNISREEVSNKLRDTSDGTYLVRDSTRTAGEYTLTVRKAGTNKLIRIINSGGKYGFSVPTTFASVSELIDFYSHTLLTKYNARLDITLSNPISRFAKVDSDDEESVVEERDADVEDLLDKLKLSTEFFDAKNKIYLEKENEYDECKKRVDMAQCFFRAQSTAVELFKEQAKIPDYHANAKYTSSERRQLLENARLLGERVQESQKAAELSRRKLHEANIEFRTMDRDINTIRPELMKLQWEKEQYTSKLLQLGFTHQQLSERIHEEAVTETESIYGTLYGTLGEAEPAQPNWDDEPSDLYEEPDDLSLSQTSQPYQPALPIPPRGDRLGSTNTERKARPRSSVDFPATLSPPPSNMKERTPSPPPPSQNKPQPDVPSKTRTLNKPDIPHEKPFGPSKSKTLSKPNSVSDDKPHWRLDTWYVEVGRNKSAELLKGKKNGTFLCRPTTRQSRLPGGELHTHSIDIIYNGEKHLKVLQQDGKYGFSIPCTHKTLLDLVLHYSERSLVQHNPSLPTTLDHPLYEDKI